VKKGEKSVSEDCEKSFTVNYAGIVRASKLFGNLVKTMGLSSPITTVSECLKPPNP
jgi:hypothetical protein